MIISSSTSLSGSPMTQFLLCCSTRLLAVAMLMELASFAHAQSSGGSYSVATLARGFSYPAGLAVDGSGNIYVADSYAQQVVKISAAGAQIETFGGSPLLDNPEAAVVDGTGNLYVADAFKNAIFRFSPSGILTVVAGQPGTSGSADGTGAGARFNFPRGLTIDPSGNLFVTEDNQLIRKITPVGVVTTLAGSVGISGTVDGTGTGARFSRPWGIVADGTGTLYVATTDSIRRVTPLGVVTTIAGAPAGRGSQDGTGAAARFAQPQGITIDGAGNLYVADTFNRTIRKITPAGVVTTIAGQAGTAAESINGPGPTARFTNPWGIAVSNDGNSIYVADDVGFQQALGLIRVLYLSSPPRILVAPQSSAINVNAAVTLTVGATGGPPPNLQWFLNGAAINGATSASFSLASAKQKDSGSYAVVATNAFGTVASSSATLTVRLSPGIATPPQRTPIGPNGTATLTVAASGTAPFNYQWLRDGSPVVGATADSFTTNVLGSYSVIVANAAGSVTSAATLVLPANRLVNLATRGLAATGADALVAGFVASGPGPKQFLIRGVGPALRAFGVSGVVAQPTLTLFSGQSVFATNSGWSGGANATQLSAATSRVGAFALPLGSADSALLVTLLPGIYSAAVSGTSEASGEALVEIYELDGDLTRLVNISTRGRVGVGGESLIAGLVVQGTVPVRVLVRGIGPSLVQFGLPNALARPKLTLLSGSTVLATNNGWNIDSSAAAGVAGAAVATGAFALSAGSPDCALLTTLAPGAYTVQVSSIDAGSGVALVEVYLVP